MIFQTVKSRQQTGTLRARVFAALMLSLTCGCTVPTVYPVVPHKSLNELYHEAVASSQNTPERQNAYNMMPAEMQPQVLPPIDNHGQPTGEAPATLFEAPENTRTNNVPLIPSAASFQDQSSGTGWQKSGKGSQPMATMKAGKIRRVSGTGGHTSSTDPVTEILEDTDVRQAIQSIASQAEVSVIIDEQVGGVVSAVIEDETFESALRKILMPLGLVYRQISESEYIVGVADPSSPLFSRLSERLDFRPQHLSPEELVKLVPEREAKFIHAVDARNRIVIEAPPEIARSLVERLQQFDTPIPQVELEAIVCVISPDHEFKSGLDWNHAVTLNGKDIFSAGMTGLALSGAGSGAGVSGAFTDFAVTSAFVKLLAQEGYLAIRAAPRVTARDGDQAKIAITRESFFSTQPQSDNAFFRQDINTVQAGIELDITPIVRGNSITMKIEKAEVSEDILTSQINSGIVENPYPQINRRTVSTTVHVNDGETIVIGGLVQRQTVDRVARVPMLGSLPGVGRMFQTVEQREQDVEVVIFISPRLVQPSCPPQTGY